MTSKSRQAQCWIFHAALISTALYLQARVLHPKFFATNLVNNFLCQRT